MLLRYLAADALSLLGNAAAAVVLPWLLLARTGDAAAAGTVAAVAALPMLLSAIGGGVLIDRIGRRTMSVCADLGSAFSIALLPVVDATVGLNLGWFILIAVAGALFDVPGMTARESMLPDVAAATGIPLERVSGLREGVSGVVLLVGPGAGAALLAVTGGAAALWLTAVTSAAAAAVTASLRQIPGGSAALRSKPRVWAADLAEGWYVVRGDRVLVALTMLTTASVAVVASLVGLVLPVRLVASAAPGWLGAVITGVAVGGIAGAGWYAAIGTRWSRRTWFLTAGSVHGAGVAALAALSAPGLMVVAAVIAGLGSGPLAAMLTVVIAERVPAAVRGRVLGLQNALALAVGPIGMFATGLAVDRFGVHAVGPLLSVAWCGVTLVALACPALRRLEVAHADDR